MTKIIEMSNYTKREMEPIEKLCQNEAGRYGVFGFILGILKFQNEQSGNDEVIKRMYRDLSEENKQLVISYAKEELARKEVAL